jgi:P27 family predicted phage terminase small subunit
MEQAPSWLNDLAREYWDNLAPEVALQNPMNAHLLAILCDMHAQYRHAREILNRDGMFVLTARGRQPKRHPAIGIMTQTAQDILRLHKLLFAGNKTSPEADPLEAFLT